MTSNVRVVGRAKAFLAACGSTSQVVRTGPWVLPVPNRSTLRMDAVIPSFHRGPVRTRLFLDEM